MDTTFAGKIRGMSPRTKICIVFMLVMGSFLYQGILKPLIGDTATNTYYFTLDSSSVNLGVDGNTTTSQTLNGKISMKTTVYATSRRVTAASNTNVQSMIRAYGPLITGGTKTLTAPAVTIGVRDGNGSTGNINWWAEIYDYNPSGTLNNGTLLWTSNTIEAHPSVQTPLELTFTNPLPKDIVVGHRIKVVIKCQMASTASSARLYWGGSTNYSFFTVSEAPYVANSLTVNNMSDYYKGQLTSVTQGDSNIPMLQFDLYSNLAGGSSWTGGKLNKIGTNTTFYISEDEPGDVSFSIYKDSDNDGLFETSDAMVGGPYNFDEGNLQKTYTLPAAQTITATPQRYFVVYNILRNSTYNTTVGARIVDNTYFSVTAATTGGVQNVTSTSSSTPNILFGGTAVTKNYPADWDNGTSLAGISESGGPAATDSTCVTRNTAGSGFPLVGLLDYPAYTCTSVSGQGYSTTTAQADFARLYFGGSSYPSIMKTIKGLSFVYRLYTPSGGGTVTLQLFYVTSGGVRVNAPITSKYTTTNSLTQTITTSLAGQDFSNVPAGARLGIQIGVTANCLLCLGSANGAKLSVQETAAENENVDVGNGAAITNASVYASDTNKVINAFTLSAAKPKTVNSIIVKGNALFDSTNVKEVRIYGELSTPSTLLGVLDGTDTLIGSTTTISGNLATISGLNLAVTSSVKRYLVVVDIGDAPNTNVTLTALVSDLTVATTGNLGVNSDSASGTLTILPTTYLSNFITAEPPSIIIPSGSGAKKIDAFALKTNGGVNDTITSVKVHLTTTSSLPAGKVISDYVGKVEIFNSSGTSLGHLTAPTQDDDWQVSTLGLAATQTPAEYFVEITPKGNQNITFTVKATVIAVTHSRTTNALVLNDTGSATLTMDQQPPTEPTLTAVTGAYSDVDLAQIDLGWNASTDLSGSAVSYIVVRGLGNAPAPRSCTADGAKVFSVYTGPLTSVTDKGLNEGVSYGYRVCAVDSVGNTGFGTTKSATASIKNRCGELPELTISPMASYIKAGNSVALDVNIINKDTGSCAPTTFTLSIVGTDIDDGNFTTSTFDGNNFIIPTNMASKFTKLNITAKPGAAEKALKTFHVKVTKSSGGETSCPDPVYVIVNKYGTMTHSSLQLGTKYGSWGLDYSCNTCHSPNSTNIKQVKNVIATPNGDRPVAFSIISTNPGADVAGVFGNDNRAGAASSNVCEVCHHNARFHQYSTSKIAWKDHNNNGDCMQCHPHSVGFKTFSTLVGCDDCHGNPPTTQAELVVPATDVLSAYATNAGSHAKHEARLVKCAACHSNGNHLINAIPDKKLNMGYKINGSNFTGFVGNVTSGTLRTLIPNNSYTYLGAAGTIIEQAPATIMTCSVYCHGWNGDGGYNSEPAWTGISQVGCGSCHAATNSDPPTSGSHHKHTSAEPGFGNSIACAKCHGFRNYSTSSAHINGNVEWDLSSITKSVGTYRDAQTGSTGNRAPTTPGSYGTCTNLYCHSNVVSSANNNGTGAPDQFSTVTWGGTTTCNSCHQAQPNMTGGHPQHAGTGAAAFDCRICHASGGDTNSLHHADDKLDFQFEGLGENTHYSYSSSKNPGSGTYGTCYNGNCHGSRREKTGVTSLTWGAATALPLCDKCHATSNLSGGFYGTAGHNSTMLNTDPYVGAHMMHISSATAKKYTAKIRCNICHLEPSLAEGPYAAGHMDTALPAEINYGTLASSGLQGSFTSAAHAPTYNFTTKQCSNLWCHGAGMNSNEGTGPYASVVFDGGTLKAPPIAAVWNAPFLDGTGANDCDKCHGFPPPAPIDGYQHYYEEQGRPYIATECILCHNHLDNTGYKFKKPELHVNGVVNSCVTCHGRPPSDEASLTVPAIGALSYGMAGAHQAHALNPSIKKDCYVCHDGYSNEMPSYRMEMGFNAYGGKVTSGTYHGYTTLSANYSPVIVYVSNNAGTIVRRTTNKETLNTCENLYCHGAGTATLAALAGGTNIKPNWEGGASQAECGSCHGVTGATYHTSSHEVHAGTGYGKLGLACVNCHGIKENNYHVDGKVEWEFYSTVKRLNLLIANPAYTPASGNGTAGPSGVTNSLAPSTSYGTCTVYCHSDGHGTYKPIAWGAPALNCGSCHINQTSVFSGSHQKHSASSANGGYGIDCLVCHHGSGFNSALHVNGALDIIFDPDMVGPSATWDNVNKKCFSILCHDSTVATGPTWNVPATGTYDGGTYKPTCIGCHSGEVNGRAAVIPQFAGESHHVQGAAMSNSYCYPCHMEALNSNGNVDDAYHDRTANKPVDLVVWSNGARGAVFTKYTANGSASRKRTEYTKVNNHCIGCHRTSNDAITPFSASGDNRTPKTYSWDIKSIYNRYSSGNVVGTDSTPWGKYSDTATTMVSPKNTQTKAYSAHGQANLNQRGWNTTETWPNTSASATAKVLCFDCHNSHGTSATGIMSSYSSATGRYKGGILKSTVNGIGGYSADYTPITGGDAAAPAKNVFNPGAALCFDCHNTRTASETVPWGYNSTFGATQGIYGYNDKPYFGNYSTFAAGVRYIYKKSNDTNKGGHFGASTTLGTPAMKPINGLCTPCHDPHGVSTTLGASRQYGVPLLKGTWMTSFYQEDAAPANVNEVRGGTNKDSSNGTSGGTSTRPARQLVGSTPGYRIDQNTLGATTTLSNTNYGTAQNATSWNLADATRMTQTDAQFAGLCTQCHTKASLAPKAGQAVAPDSWKSVSRIHGTVKGWATTVQASDGNYNNTIHSFPCAKCHTPHNAKLPRLMVSNCLDYNHRGRVASGGTVSATAGNASGGNGLTNIAGSGHQLINGEKDDGQGRFPAGGGRLTNNKDKAQNWGTGNVTTAPNKWFFGNSGTTTGSASFRNCHDAANTIDAAYPAKQLWNTKTLW